jgi:hypothetical protein
MLYPVLLTFLHDFVVFVVVLVQFFVPMRTNGVISHLQDRLLRFHLLGFLVQRRFSKKKRVVRWEYELGVQTPHATVHGAGRQGVASLEDIRQGQLCASTSAAAELFCPGRPPTSALAEVAFYSSRLWHVSSRMRRSLIFPVQGQWVRV